MRVGGRLGVADGSLLSLEHLGSLSSAHVPPVASKEAQGPLLAAPRRLDSETLTLLRVRAPFFGRLSCRGVTRSVAFPAQRTARGQPVASACRGATRKSSTHTMGTCKVWEASLPRCRSARAMQGVCFCRGGSACGAYAVSAGIGRLLSAWRRPPAWRMESGPLLAAVLEDAPTAGNREVRQWLRSDAWAAKVLPADVAEDTTVASAVEAGHAYKRRGACRRRAIHSGGPAPSQHSRILGSRTASVVRSRLPSSAVG